MNMLRRIVLAATLGAGLLGPLAAFGQAPPPVPALPDTERRTSYSISGTTCTCAVNFALYGDSTDYQDWVEVWLNGVQVAYNDATYGWTITSATGPLATIPRPVTDAVLTFTNAQTGTVQIVGARRPRRTSQFSENRGVAARDLNQALTDIIAQNRETWDKINDVTGRGLFSQPGVTLGPLPLPSACANRFIGFDNGGTNPLCLAGGPGSGNVVGPVSSTVGNLAIWNNTTGTSLADAGFSITGFANPAASTGLTVINGVATTAMRSDAAPALSSSVQSALTGTNNAILKGTGAFGFSAAPTGTGVLTALGVNIGSAGAFVVNGGALGSPSSAGTMPAFTLGGTIAGGGNQINNVIIGTSTPLAGSFTSLVSTSLVTTANSATGWTLQDASSSQDKVVFGAQTVATCDVLGTMLGSNACGSLLFTPNATATWNALNITATNSRVEISADGGGVKPTIILADTTNALPIMTTTTSGGFTTGVGLIGFAKQSTHTQFTISFASLGGSTTEVDNSLYLNIYSTALTGGTQSSILFWNATGSNNWNGTKSATLTGKRLGELGGLPTLPDGNFTQSETWSINGYQELTSTGTTNDGSYTSPANIVFRLAPNAMHQFRNVSVFDYNANLLLGASGSTNCFAESRNGDSVNTKNSIVFCNAGGLPSGNPAFGGYLFTDAGSLKYKGSSGSVTVLAPP